MCFVFKPLTLTDINDFPMMDGFKERYRDMNCCKTKTSLFKSTIHVSLNFHLFLSSGLPVFFSCLTICKCVRIKKIFKKKNCYAIFTWKYIWSTFWMNTNFLYLLQQKPWKPVSIFGNETAETLRWQQRWVQ